MYTYETKFQLSKLSESTVEFKTMSPHSVCYDAMITKPMLAPRFFEAPSVGNLMDLIECNKNKVSYTKLTDEIRNQRPAITT